MGTDYSSTASASAAIATTTSEVLVGEAPESSTTVKLEGPATEASAEAHNRAPSSSMGSTVESSRVSQAGPHQQDDDESRSELILTEGQQNVLEMAGKLNIVT